MIRRWLLLLGCIAFGSVESKRWNLVNCRLDSANGAVKGVVTDAVCVSDEQNQCLPFSTQEACMLEGACLWYEDRGCDLNRDSRNNVCTSSGSFDDKCVALTQGQCPSTDFELPRDCCPPPYDNYAGILNTTSPRTVCCNAPCTAIEQAYDQGLASCSAVHFPQCAPTKRSNMMQMFQRLGGGGFGSVVKPAAVRNVLGFSSGQSGRKLGFLTKGFGGMGGFGSMGAGRTGMSPMTMMNMMKSLKKNKNPEQKAKKPKNIKVTVQEATMDDFMRNLMEALDKDEKKVVAKPKPKTLLEQMMSMMGGGSMMRGKGMFGSPMGIMGGFGRSPMGSSMMNSMSMMKMMGGFGKLPF